MKKTTSALALLIAAALSGCAAHTTPASNASVTEKTAQPAVSDVQQRRWRMGYMKWRLARQGMSCTLQAPKDLKMCRAVWFTSWIRKRLKRSA